MKVGKWRAGERPGSEAMAPRTTAELTAPQVTTTEVTAPGMSARSMAGRGGNGNSPMESSGIRGPSDARRGEQCDQDDRDCEQQPLAWMLNRWVHHLDTPWTRPGEAATRGGSRRLGVEPLGRNAPN